MTSGIRLGTIMGIPIRLDYSWFIIFGLVALSLSFGFFPAALPKMPVYHYLLLGLVTTLLFFGSVLLHELAHSYVAIRRGLPVSSITLFIFGGISALEEEPKSPRVELQMAIIGPLTSLVLAVVFFLIAWGSAAQKSHVWATATQLWWINAFVGVFNLLPAFPLDGGRVLRSIVWQVTGSLRKATLAASAVGQGFGYVLIGLGIVSFFAGGVMSGIWVAFIGWFLLNAAQSSHQQTMLQEALSGIPVSELSLAEMPIVAPDMSVQAFVDEYLLRRPENLFPIGGDGRPLGAVGIEEVQNLPKEEWGTSAVSQIVRAFRDNEVIAHDADAWEAVQRLGQADCECQFVMRGEQLQGVLTRTGVVRWIQTKRELGLTRVGR
ncbi:MAG: hypothetical protein GTN69_11940 [Armatimonadetes bacterium]|nr:hypothetical protein [Armatimonadota bacterium]